MHHNRFWNLLAKHLSGEASTQEKAELEAIIKANPGLSYPAQHITDLWKLKGGYDVAEAEAVFKKHMTLIEAEDTPIEASLYRSTRKRKKLHLLFYSIGLVVVIIVSWLMLTNHPKSITNSPLSVAEVTTRPGSRTRIQLPDSSTVWLNAGSKLTYTQPFGVADRSVTLTGEAFFDVVKMTKPFIIHTEGVQIKVLGTAFNVRSYPDEKKIETSLVRGRVEVTLDRLPQKKYVLQPNEKLTLGTENGQSPAGENKKVSQLPVITALQHFDSATIAETSWVENKLVFVDESFEEVARKMERWYGVTIEFKNDRVKRERFTGVFEKETVGQALAALSITVPFHFTVKDKEIIITP